MRKQIQRLSFTARPLAWKSPLLLMTVMLSLFSLSSFAQVLISPTGAGGFELGSTPSANGWTAVNSSTDAWVVGTTPVVSAGSNCGFISSTPSTTKTWTYSQLSVFQHLYMDVTMPAGMSIANLSFKWKVGGEGTTTSDWDNLKVFWGLASAYTPTLNTANSATYQVSGPGATSGMYKLSSAAYNTESFGFAGTPGATYRLCFSWKSDVSTIANPPAAIDEVSLTASAPSTFTATANGGLWSDGATWVGGVAPASGVGNSIVIPNGSTVIANQSINYADYTIDGRLIWGSTAITSPAMTATGNVTIGSTGRVIAITSGGTGQNIACLGNFTNNGYANLIVSTLIFSGSGTQNLDGTGTFQGNGTEGVISGIQMQGSGTLNINTTQNLIARTLNPLIGNIQTNSKLQMHNGKSTVFGQAWNRQVQDVWLTAMGTTLTAAPSIAGAGAANWAASTAVSLGNIRVSGNNVYAVTTAGTTGTVAPTHTSSTAANGTATLLWVGNTGTIGTPFVLSVTAGTQYYYGNNLYTCTVGGTASAAAPPTHTSGTALSGATVTFAYVGTAARLSVNYDATSQTVRSLNIVSAGDGYNSSPSIVFLNNGTGTLPTASSLVVHGNSSTGAQMNKQSGPGSTISGALPINASQSVTNIFVSGANGGGFYPSVPNVGITPPTGINLMTLAGTTQGSGCTVAGTYAFTGGTIVNAGTATLTATIANGKLIGLVFSGTAQYSSPPTGVSITGATYGTAPTFGAAFTTALASVCATATVTLSNGTNGQVRGFTITNGGSGYVALPTVGYSTVAGSVIPTTTTAVVSTYNLTVANFTITAVNGVTPTSTLGNQTESGIIPSSRLINALSLGTGGQGLTLSGGDLTLINSAPLTLTSGVLNLGGSNLIGQHPSYYGQVAAAASYVSNGGIQLNGISTTTLTRTFPINAGAAAGAVLSIGSGSTATGSDITRVTLTESGAPSGAVSGAGNMTGTRTVTVSLSGTAFGTSPTMQLPWASQDNLITDNQSLYLCQSNSGITSGWSARSATGLAGALANAGTRTSVTAASAPASPIVFASTMYFGWSTSFVAPPALSYSVARTTANTYNSIMPTSLGGDNTGLAFTYSNLSTDEAVTNVVAIPFTFNYQGSAVTGLRASSNGYISLQNGLSSTTIGTGDYYNTFNNRGSSASTVTGGTGLTARNVIAPFFEDLTTNPNSGGQTTLDNSMRYVITGTTPNRKLIIEWYKMTFFGLAGPELYWQVVLNESDQSIEFKYGNMQLFNGTQNIRWSYTCGIGGSLVSANPAPGQVFTLQYVNTTAFSNNAPSCNLAGNGLAECPEPRSTYKFTPGTYTAPSPFTPVVSAPANDNPGGAIALTSFSSFPTNIAWDHTTNRSNYFSTRGATYNASYPVCAGPTAPKDVWFTFTAADPNTQVRVYGSGGFIPRVEVQDEFNNPLSPAICVVGTIGSAVTATLTGLTVGNQYFVRVYHDLNGTTALATASVSSGSVTGITITTPGTNYPDIAPPFTYTPNSRSAIIDITGGGGYGAAATVCFTPTGGSLTSGNLCFTGGIGYTSTPTVTISSPDDGVSGEFGIIVFPKPTNDNCSGGTAGADEPMRLINTTSPAPVNAVNLSGASVNGTTTLTVSSTAALGIAGTQWMVTGPLIPLNTIATVATGTTLTLSAAATGTSSGLTMRFSQNKISGVSTGAASASGETAPSCGTPDDDLWYTFTSSQADLTIVATGQGGFDPAIAVYISPTTNCADKFNLLSSTSPSFPYSSAQCLNATGVGGTESMNITNSSGTTFTYFVRVYHAGSGSVIGGSFDLSVYQALPLQYRFSQSTAAYSAISGGTQLASGTIDDAVFKVIPSPGYSFNLIPIDSIFVSSNGFLMFNQRPATTLVSPLINSGGLGVASAFAFDLQDAAGAGEIRYEYVAPEHVFQYTGMRRKASTGESLDFQIRLNATTGDVVYHYGAATAGSLSGIVRVGIRTDQTTNTTVTETPVNTVVRPAKVYVMNRTTLGSPTNQTFDKTTTANDPTLAVGVSSTSFPVNGMKISYTSSSCTPPSAVSNIIGSFDPALPITISWRRVPGAANGYLVYYRTAATSGASTTTVSTAAEGDTSYTFAAGTLNGGNYYIWDVAARCGAAANEEAHRSTGGIFATYGDPIAYNVSYSSGTYTALTGATNVFSGSGADDEHYPIVLPTPVRINDQDFTDVTLSTNGYLMGGIVTLGTTAYNPLGSLNGLGLVSPFGDDLGSSATNAKIRWEDLGTEYVFEWVNWERFVGGENFDFQARYNKTSKAWSFVYRGMNTITTTDSFDVGIRGTTNQLRRDVLALTGAPDWTKPVVGQRSAANTAKKFVVTSTVRPANGYTITFTPITCQGLPAVTSPVTAFTAPEVAAVIGKNDITNLKWRRAVNPLNNNSAGSGYLIRYRTIAESEAVSTWATPTASGSGQNDTTADLSGLVPGQEYVVQVAGRCSGSSSTAFGAASRFFTLPADNDLRLTSVQSPTATSCFTNATPVTIRFTNSGLLTIPASTSIPYTLNVSTPGGPQTITGTHVTTGGIAPGASLDILAGNLDMSASGSYTFLTTSNHNWAADEVPANDTLTTAYTISGVIPSITLVPPAVYSYGFNSILTDPGVFIQTVTSPQSWIQGTGASVTLRSAAPVGSIAPHEGSGFAVVDDITQIFSTNRLVLPCMTVPSCYEARFWATRWNGNNNTSEIRVKISTNGGATWTGNLTLTNLTTGRDTTQIRQFYGPASTPTWHQFALDLGAYAGQNIRIAFEGENASGTSTNFGVDDFKLQPKVGDDVAYTALISPVSGGSCGSASTPVTVQIRNKGCNKQYNVPVNVSVTGGSPSSFSAIVDSIDSEQSLNVTVGNVVANAGVSTLSFSGNVVLSGDAVAGDNIFSGTTVQVKPSPILNLSTGNTNLVINASSGIGATASIPSGSFATFANGTSYSITDNGASIGDSAISPIVVPASVTGGASSVKKVVINITHTFDGDLDIFLRAPSGQRIQLSTDNGGGGDNFINTTFIPAATAGGTNITSGSAPFTGDYYPEDDFSTLTGSAAGTWELVVADDAGTDVGTLLNWNIQFDNVIISAVWSSTPAFTGFPYNCPSPNTSVNWSSPTITSATAASVTTSLLISDASGCTISKDTTYNWFSSNIWLGVNDGAANWNDPANWYAFPKPPTATQRITIPKVGDLNAEGNPVLYPPKSNTAIIIGTMEMSNNSELVLSAGGQLDVAANWSGVNSSVTGDGVVNFNSSGSQTISGSTNFNNLTVTKSVATSKLNIAGTARVLGTLTLANATSNINVASTGSLVLASSASQTGRLASVPNGAGISGNVTMERWLPWTAGGALGQWYFLSSPILNKNFSDWSDDFKVSGSSAAYGAQGGGIINTGIYDQNNTIFNYTESLFADSTSLVVKNGWTSPSGNIINGAGYRVFVDKYSNSTHKADNVGEVKIGTVTFPALTRSSSGACTPASYTNCDLTRNGYNFVGNPYPSPINWDATGGAWIKPANMTPGFWRYNSDLGYGLYTSGVWTGASPAPSNPNVIPSSQAFFVRLTSGTGGSMSVTESAKIGTSGAFLRTSEVYPNRLRINLNKVNQGGQYFYSGIVQFKDEATDGYDMDFDFSNMGSQNYSFSFPVDNNELLFNSMGALTEQKVVPINTWFMGQTGTYSFSFEDLSSFDAGVEVFLRDKYNNTIQNITTNSTVTFEVSSGSIGMADRFELVFNPSAVTDVKGLGSGQFFGIRPNPGSGASKVVFSVSGVNDIDGVINIVDMVGKVVFTSKMDLISGKLSEKEFVLGLPAGVYTVKFNSRQSAFMEKLVIR